VQGVVGRVDSTGTLLDPYYVDLAHIGSGEGGAEIFSAATPLPVAGTMGYTARVLPNHRLLAGPAEWGLVRLAGDGQSGDGVMASEAHL
jgi:starch phosphorylase